MIKDWLEARRASKTQSDAEIQGFVDGVLSGEVTRPQAAAWLAFVFLNGMSRSEAVALTRAMTESGALQAQGVVAPVAGDAREGHEGGALRVALTAALVWARRGAWRCGLDGRLRW